MRGESSVMKINVMNGVAGQSGKYCRENCRVFAGACSGAGDSVTGKKWPYLSPAFWERCSVTNGHRLQLVVCRVAK